MRMVKVRCKTMHVCDGVSMDRREEILRANAIQVCNLALLLNSSGIISANGLCNNAADGRACSCFVKGVLRSRR